MNVSTEIDELSNMQDVAEAGLQDRFFFLIKNKAEIKKRGGLKLYGCDTSSIDRKA